ncbi:hypothetical protein A0H81_12842 [Grifola frondosa]|uniref:Uncharacterized protein n=1 Tax=Grifola frondosa TaxID=5627 RepID=A0A1C7LQU0_GRIFR|nr:hypothetical protein A0H81_12842 [Grifola frondosa]
MEGVCVLILMNHNELVVKPSQPTAIHPRSKGLGVFFLSQLKKHSDVDQSWEHFLSPFPHWLLLMIVWRLCRFENLIVFPTNQVYSIPFDSRSLPFTGNDMDTYEKGRDSGP